MVFTFQAVNPRWFAPLAPETAAEWVAIEKGQGRYARWVYRGFFRLFAQGPVDVMNRLDIERVGQHFFVVCEVDESGVPVRVVPYLDDAGGRLDYLRNDLLYYRYALPWQRTAPPWEPSVMSN